MGPAKFGTTPGGGDSEGKFPYSCNTSGDKLDGLFAMIASIHTRKCLFVRNNHGSRQKKDRVDKKKKKEKKKGIIIDSREATREAFRYI